MRSCETDFGDADWIQLAENYCHAAECDYRRVLDCTPKITVTTEHVKSSQSLLCVAW
jgi:hypothetical protein